MRSDISRTASAHCCERASPAAVRWIVALGFFCAVLTGCMSLDLGRPLQPDAHDWLSQGGSEYQQHYVDASITLPLEEKWRYNAHAGFGSGSPLIVGKTIFVSSRNGQVHALSLTNGDRRGREEFGEAIEGAPVVTDSMLYIPVSWDNPQLVAYDVVEGRIVWRRQGTAVEAGLSLRENLLFAADVQGRVTAFDRATGDTVWTAPSDSLVSYLAAPVLAGDHLIAADDRGHVRAFHVRTGELAWERSLGEPVEHTPAVLRESVYIPSVRGTLWTLDVRTGQIKWEYQTDERPRRLTTPAVSDQMLVLAASDGTVRRIDPADGSVVWINAIGGPITAAPLLLQNAIVVGSMDATVYALGPAEGDVRWSQSVEGRIKSAPVFKEEHLIILAEPSHVYAFAPNTSESVAASDPSSAR